MYMFVLIQQIAAWTADIAKQNPALVSRSQIGTTFEGRPMYLLKVFALEFHSQSVLLFLGV